MGLTDHELIYCSRRASLLKLNEYYEISFRSVKHYLDELFFRQFKINKIS